MKRAACILIGALVVLAIVVACCCHQDPFTQDREAILAPASAHHWAGTDDLGRDRAARLAAALLFGSTGALVVALAATSLAVAAALAIAFGPAAAAHLLRYGCDACLSLPWLFLLMMVRSVLPLNVSPVRCGLITMLILALLGWPLHVRSLTARLQATRHADWMLHTRAGGLSRLRIALRHVLPHLRSLYLTQFLICVPLCIFAEADLGAIGFGMTEPLVSWGTLLQDLGSSAQTSATHWVYAPLGLLLLLLLSFECLVLEK